MKSTIAALAFLFAATALAQDTTNLPTCAQSCALSSIGNSNGCTITDAQCLCTDQGYQSAFTTCVISSCNTQDQQSAATWGTAYCASAGVTLTATPTPTSTASDSSASSSAASSASEAASSVTESASSSASSASSSVSSAASSSLSSARHSATSAMQSASSAASSASSAAAAPTKGVAWEVLGLGAAAAAALF